MSTTENNKLIAEFMGFQQTNLGWYDAEEILLRAERDNTFDNLKFHTDWNWLMEVVEKIESIVWEELNDTSFNVTIGATSYCVIQDNNGGVIEIIGQGGTKIESVYKAVVDFIKWYNENSK
jgi:hypothetical protein